MTFNFRDYFMMTLGLLIVALSIHFFMAPNNFVVGGVSGLAIVFNKLFPLISYSIFMMIFNIILFLIGFIFIGSSFGTKTIYSSFMLSFIVWLLELIYPMKTPFTNEMFVELILCILLSAIGMAMVFRHNASTGGTDITAKILNKYFHIDLGKGVLICDLVITLSAIIAFDISVVFYGIVGLFLNGLIIDYILDKLKEAKEITIVSKENDRIKQFITSELERGATIYLARGAYTNENKDIVITILSKYEYIKLKKYILDENINAFITVNNIHETFGEGFQTLDF
jgi:uncharacterized membrane-anchored protein YitT (DUF2179 family)